MTYPRRILAGLSAPERAAMAAVIHDALAAGLPDTAMIALEDWLNTGELPCIYETARQPWRGQDLLWQAALAATAEAAQAAEPAWIVRHRIILAVLFVIMVALAEPAIADVLPPEVRHLLELEHGPLAYGIVIAGLIVGTAAVTGRTG